MTPRWVWIALSTALVAIVTLAFMVPHQMASPGNLRSGHAGLQQDCFACHSPFRGATADRCLGCHRLADIGRRTTKGATIFWSRIPPFHESLAQQDCMACHTDHPRPRLTRNVVPSFAHALLRSDLRGRCATCHSPPKNDLHPGVDLPCGQCHGDKAWKPARFEHSGYFSLAPPHDASCATCHVDGNFRSYTCYGCHAHSKARTEAKHLKEGLRNIQDCARCHRGAEGGHGEDGRDSGGDREN